MIWGLNGIVRWAPVDVNLVIIQFFPLPLYQTPLLHLKKKKSFIQPWEEATGILRPRLCNLWAPNVGCEAGKFAAEAASEAASERVGGSGEGKGSVWRWERRDRKGTKSEQEWKQKKAKPTKPNQAIWYSSSFSLGKEQCAGTGRALEQVWAAQRF